MATITFTVTNSGGTINLTHSYDFADNDLTRLATWAKNLYPNSDGTLPSNQVAWDRLTLATAKTFLKNIKRYEQDVAAASAIAGVTAVSEPT